MSYTSSKISPTRHSSLNNGYRFLSCSPISILAAAAAAATIACRPGVGIPPKPLPSCRAYVVQQTCTDTQQTTPGKVASKDPCCRELEAVSEECRCTAMEDFMQGMLRLEGVPEGWEFTMSLVKPETCNLKTITGGPYCGLPPSNDARLADVYIKVIKLAT
ncbi:hypothetical protein VPH35_017881 [Triticum aestivum]